MDPAVYKVYYELERDHWWNQSKRNIILSLLDRHGHLQSDSKIADIGAGTGSYSETLSQRGLTVEAHDASAFAVECLRESKIPHVQKNFPEDYQQIKNEYDAVLLLDILEHIEDDRSALDTALQMLKPGGILICTVPACKQMWGEYDLCAHHYRRYDLADMRQLLSGKKVQVEKLSYYSTILFPFLFSVRFVENFLFKKSKREPIFRPHFVPGALNKILYHIFNLEKSLLTFLNFSFGSALVAVLRKTKT